MSKRLEPKALVCLEPRARWVRTVRLACDYLCTWNLACGHLCICTLSLACGCPRPDTWSLSCVRLCRSNWRVACTKPAISLDCVTTLMVGPIGLSTHEVEREWHSSSAWGYFVVVPRLGVTQVAKSAHKRGRTFRKATEWGLQSMASTQS